ncbi:ECs1072 family phage-associated protein [Dickeya zeae]|uniref:ECs1072 family phage-associated protein n=1 Tax=Dickeya zeae TaxID=204042 RepID=UPI002052D96C|nr:hypothetical protein [Dickeya zeae]UPT55490.1 hypothetical protein FGI00_07960 [Dickeya zeae]
MDLNLNACLNVYVKTAENIAHALKIDNPRNTYILPFITIRSLILFKLELILFKHREEFDKRRQILFGINALTHYLVHKKGMSIADARNIRLHDAILFLWNEINNYEIPSDVMNFIINHSGYYSNDNEDISQLTEKHSVYINPEWDANFADKELSK